MYGLKDILSKVDEGVPLFPSTLVDTMISDGRKAYNERRLDLRMSFNTFLPLWVYSYQMYEEKVWAQWRDASQGPFGRRGADAGPGWYLLSDSRYLEEQHRVHSTFEEFPGTGLSTVKIGGLCVRYAPLPAADVALSQAVAWLAPPEAWEKFLPNSADLESRFARHPLPLNEDCRELVDLCLACKNQETPNQDLTNKVHVVLTTPEAKEAQLEKFFEGVIGLRTPI